MFMTSAQITRGDVVACGASAYIVHNIKNDRVTLLRLENAKEAKHRADVVPDSWTDLALSGLPLQHVVIRCVPVLLRGAANLTRLGTLSENLWKRVMIAFDRELLTRRFEDSPAVRSNLEASTSSCGRRVSAVRYA